MMSARIGMLWLALVLAGCGSDTTKSDSDDETTSECGGCSAPTVCGEPADPCSCGPCTEGQGPFVRDGVDHYCTAEGCLAPGSPPGSGGSGGAAMGGGPATGGSGGS